MKRLRVVLLALAASGCSMSKQGFVNFSHDKAGFAADIPADWTVIENSAGFNPGAQFLSPPPRGRRAVRRYMTVDFYPADDKQYGSIEEYVTAHTRSMPGYSHDELKSAMVSGFPAKELVWMKPLPQSPEFAPKGSLVTRALLFPYGGGFFVLCDARREGDPADAGRVFERLVKSFKLTGGR